MFDKLMDVLNNFDDQKRGMHQLDIRFFGDGSGRAKITDVSDGALVWYLGFDSFSEFQDGMLGKIHNGISAADLTFEQLAAYPEVQRDIWTCIGRTALERAWPKMVDLVDERRAADRERATIRPRGKTKQPRRRARAQAPKA
jgi:hypothetical protein